MSEEKKTEPQQPALFEKGNWWDSAWAGMPEFVQENQMPFRTIYVHFENNEDVQAFANLIGQRITANIKYLWFPEADIAHVANTRYIAEQEEENEDVEILDEW